MPTYLPKIDQFKPGSQLWCWHWESLRVVSITGKHIFPGQILFMTYKNSTIWLIERCERYALELTPKLKLFLFQHHPDARNATLSLAVNQGLHMMEMSIVSGFYCYNKSLLGELYKFSLQRHPNAGNKVLASASHCKLGIPIGQPTKYNASL